MVNTAHMHFIFAIPPLLAIMLSACLTTRNAKDIREYRSPINEFDRSIVAGAHTIRAGNLVEQDGKAVLEFANILIGKNRYLRIITTANGMEFSESTTALPNGQKIFMIQQNACCIDDKAFHKILFLKSGEHIAPGEILQSYYNFDAGQEAYPNSLTVIDFTNIYAFSAMHVFWQKNAQVSYFVQVPGSDYGATMHAIEWQQRSYIKLGGMYLWYVVTVPVDIATSPFQMLWLYAMGKSVK